MQQSATVRRPSDRPPQTYADQHLRNAQLRCTLCCNPRATFLCHSFHPPRPSSAVSHSRSTPIPPDSGRGFNVERKGMHGQRRRVEFASPKRQRGKVPYLTCASHKYDPEEVKAGRQQLCGAIPPDKRCHVCSSRSAYIASCISNEDKKFFDFLAETYLSSAWSSVGVADTRGFAGLT